MDKTPNAAPLMSPATQANRGPITLGVMVVTVLSAVDSTIVNISLPHIQGSLLASPEQITWVLTSYILGLVVMTPVTGWLSGRLGMKRMLLFTVTGFTVVSLLCGMATNLPEMVLLRVLHGMLGAPIMPLAQTVLLNINPPHRHTRAMGLFMLAGMASPVVGPVLGGFLTEALSWRWCFYINAPLGVISLLLLWIFLPDETPSQRRFDFLGFISLGLGIAGIQLMLDRGPSRDWFSSPEIVAEAVVAACSLWIFLVHSMTTKHTLFDMKILKDRNFVATTILGFFFMILTYANMAMLPLMMQISLGYPVMHAGIISMPRGLIILVTVVVVARLPPRLDQRILIGLGVVLLTIGYGQMGSFDLNMPEKDILIATLIAGVGQGLCFLPAGVLAFTTLDPKLRADASGVASLIRFLGASMGISVMQANLSYNTQSMHSALSEHISADNLVARAALPPHMSPGAVQGAMALNEEITRQATMVAFLDNFRLMTMIAIACLPLLLLLRQSRARRATASSAEVHVA